MTTLVSTAAALAFAGASAQSPDPLKSRECGAALRQLEDVLADPTRRHVREQRVASARRSAALICLGGSESGERSGAPYPAQSVLPPTIAGTPSVPFRPVGSAPAPMVIPRPTVVTTCDPAGCWDSEGRRLNHIGPLLVGPRGPCTVQGGLATCP